MLALVLAAVALLEPGPITQTTREYATAIHEETKDTAVHPFLVVALAHRETGGKWLPNLKSRTNDYGLLQLHVSHTVNRQYRGREHELFDVRTNVRLGVRQLVYWRTFHRKRCRKTRHPWWSHYQWGVRVGNAKSGRGVGRIYRRLLRRFGTVPNA